jgi:hypothetical protein
MDGMAKVVSVRVPEDLADWLDGYAERRGVTRGALVLSALVEFRDSAERGVPDLDRAPRIRAAESAHEMVMRARQMALNRELGHG